MHKICIWMNIPSHYHSTFFQALDRRADIDLQGGLFQWCVAGSLAKELYAYVLEPMLPGRHGAAAWACFEKSITLGSSAVRLVAALGAWGCE